MSRRAMVAWSAALLTIPVTCATSRAEQQCPGGIVDLHGVVQFVPVEGGCWQFEDDLGNHYEPFGGPEDMYCEGYEGSLVGCLRPDLASTCQVGAIVEVLAFEPDSFTVHGTMHFTGVEGGCWQFLADDKTPYEPMGGPAELFVDGASGSMTAYPICLVTSFCQVGELCCALEFTSDDADCPADLDGDLYVNANDLVALVHAWGRSDHDMNGGRAVGLSDLLAVIESWGPCEE